ncbi:C-terminal binding protein [Devosia rhizoryzae]|uniref:C-terminal binding protein n=1 Tax=Devosia rhizoryzae TaxID=2774137 RepID=A0ABX7C593_9HYPH|nr:C-terminal binding protein [Devosia rhizoryzae]QQR38429.1 C-terminal binding protein [Devosia rhizoryzae]
MTRRVVVTDYNFADLQFERAAAAAEGADFVVAQCRDAGAVGTQLAGADVAVVQFAPVDAEAVAGMAPGGRLIRYGVGYNNIDVAAARASGREVAYVPDYCTDEVADHTATLALMLLRRIGQLDESLRAGRWNVLETAPSIRAPRDLLIGLLGLGRIGRATLARLAPFGFSFAVCDPMLSPSDAEALGVTLLDRAELIGSADLISLHLPLTAETRHVLDATALAGMKPGSMVVNTARGGLIDEAALAAALASGHLGGAALDVFETEPLPDNSPLRQAPGIILTPHAAWYSATALSRLQSLVADEISRALTGQAARRPVPHSTEPS